jgi:predicted membrane-bound dolichyl-phosphate-mannose-protein mannosyltransferase
MLLSRKSQQEERKHGHIHVGLGVFFIVILFLVFAVIASTYLSPMGTARSDSDEYIYASSAIYMLTHHVCQPYSLSNAPSARLCNLEHPPLIKAIMALSINFLGMNKWGVRLPSLIFGALAIPMLAQIVWKLSNKNKSATVMGASLIAFNPLLVGLSSVAMLDTGEMFFFLAGFALYFSDFARSHSNYKFLLIGILFGLSVLSKEVGILALFALVTYHLLKYRNASSLKQLVLVGAGFCCAVFSGYEAYDRYFTTFPSIMSHIQFMLSYAASVHGYYLRESPFLWLVSLSSKDLASGLGVINILLIAPLAVWVPFVVFVLLKRKSASEFLFPFALFLWTYLPYFIVWYLGRDEKMFYAIQLCPALAIGAALVYSRLANSLSFAKPYISMIIGSSSLLVLLYYFLGGLGI